MSASVNKVILIGRLGRDPEIHYTKSGKGVANFTIATDETFKDNSGEKQKKTEWHNIVVWGPSVENFVQPYIHSGDLVYIEGKLQTRSWEDKKNGGTRYTTEVNATDIKGLILNNANGSDKSSKKSTKPATRKAAPVEPEDNNDEVDPEDVGF